MQTGRRAWKCELSTVDTGFLLAGMLTVAAYFDLNTIDENEIRSIADVGLRRGDSTAVGWRRNRRKAASAAGHCAPR
jgi:hypothetical protein